MNKRNKEEFLQLIQASLGVANLPEIHEDDYELLYEEFKAHSIIGLPASIISVIQNIPIELNQKWKKDILNLFCDGIQYIECQQELIKVLLSHQIRFVILKGTAASQYYDAPNFRVMGDIDIMPVRDQFDKTCEILLKHGYEKLTYNPPYKCMELRKGRALVEVHRYFAKMNDPQKAEYLDSMIVNNIKGGTVYLTDSINGLVLLQHIDHHLENGLGLRQIIDWYMFVRRYLSDDNWNNHFSAFARNIGLEKLAKTLTQMCQIYLGLDPSIQWCASADRKLCDDLMDYILDSGNFGNKYQRQEFAIQKAFLDIKHPIRYVKKMQEYGKIRMIQDQIKYWPSSFAWCYQLKYSLVQLFCHHITPVSIVRQVTQALRKKHMFDELGVKQEIKGLAIYDNGKYIIKNDII